MCSSHDMSQRGVYGMRQDYAFWSKEMSPVPQHYFQAPIVYESKPKNGIHRHPSPFVSLAY